MNNTTLHIPIDKKVREQLETKAKQLGFDSAQAYIRVWAKAEAEGRTLSFGDDWGQPTPAAAARLNKAAKEAAEGKNISEPFNTIQEAIEHLHAL